MSVRAAVAAAFALFALAWFVPRVQADNPGGLSFGAAEPISLPDANAGAVPAEPVHLSIANGSGASMRVRVYVQPLGPNGHPFLGAPTISPGSGGCSMAKVATLGATLEFLLPAGAACPMTASVITTIGSGNYSASVVATGSPVNPSAGTASSASVVVSLKVNPAATPTPSANMLRDPLPDTVSLTAEQFPGSTPIPISIDPAAAVAVTPLVGIDGSTVSALLAKDGTLSIPTIPGPGVYTGALANEKGESAAKLTLTVRHAPWLPLVVTFVGAILGFLAQLWTGRIRPIWELEDRLRRVAERELLATDVERAWVADLANNWLGNPAEQLEIYRGDAEARPPLHGVLGIAITEARDDFRSMADAAERDKQFGAVTGERTKVINGLVESVAGAREQGHAVNGALGAVASAIEAERTYGSSAWKVTMPAVLNGGLVNTEPELKAVISARDEAIKELARANQTLAIAEAALIGGAPVAKVMAVTTALARMSGWTDMAWKPVDDALVALKADEPPAGPTIAERIGILIGSRIRLPQTSGGGLNTLADGAAIGEAVAGAIEQVWDGVGHSFARLVRLFGAVVRSILGVPGASAQFVAFAWRQLVLYRLLAGDALYMCLVTLIAVLTGLNLEYLSKVSFGSFSDYLTLFLWAFAVTSIADAARSLLAGRAAQSAGL